MPPKPVAKPIASPALKRSTPLKAEKSTPVTSAKSGALGPGKVAPKATQKATKPKKADTSDGGKTKKYSLPLSEQEHDALIALKHALSDASGGKVKKGDLLRAAVRLLLKQPRTKVTAELAILSAAAGKEAD